MRRMLFIIAWSALFASRRRGSRCVATHQAITRDGFRPGGSITIASETTVAWTNRDTVNHQVVVRRPVHVADAAPRVRVSFTFTFRASGQYRYRDVAGAGGARHHVRGPPSGLPSRSTSRS